MSMLAEPRRKQKWTLNPRGKEWSEDSNKFGQKMLEKMGWTSGKGLGANEQGITEHVRVSVKNDTTGIGYKQDALDEAWTEHQDSFNDFLQKLQQNECHNVAQTEESKGVLSGKSLELKSKQSRARVHYQKFTRGKDVNKYSSKDLANIFGQKELNINKSNKDKQGNAEENFDSVGTCDNRNGIITINGGNMAEYFMKKGQDFSLACKNKKQQEDDIEEESEYAGFGFASTSRKVKCHDNKESMEVKSVCNYAFENPCVELNSPENTSNFNIESKFSKKKKLDDNELRLSSKVKKFKENNVNEKRCESGIINAGLNLECQADEVCNGKEFEISRVQFGLTNSALDLSDEINDKKRVTFNDHVEYSTDCVKTKKTLDKFEVENKKAKKKKKYNSDVNSSVLSGCVNEALDVGTPEEVHDNEVNEHKSKKSKKRKRSRSNLETIVETPEEEKACENETEIEQTKMEDYIPDDCILEDVSSKKKKRKKYKDKIQVTTENRCDEKESMEKETGANTNVILKEEECKINETQENISKSKKKKKKKNKERYTESNFEKDEDITEIEVELENVKAEKTELETAKAGKKKSRKNDNVNDLSSTTNVPNNIKGEKEVSDKENTRNMNESETEKPEKDKKFIDKSANYSIDGKKFVKRRDKIFTNTRLKKSNNRRSNTSSRPGNQRSRMTKKVLMSLFYSKSILDFPGSNMHEIKGYGADQH
ncbi:G patch domain-containing protein 4 isoform X1 [Bombus bifarius]|uniref:G patch domain-containing protein 4 isoform X1 n=1 Tax=Bombus bifarius TaxID=103933 RepID=A0A6P8NK20_9HYME|nr:G patch domain-containing protein 4 isoform X1 [Bombus bifarius]XP_033314801.1 G patch domain-containing protein 4 isoform X1 [Bombus bifarius]